MQPNLTYIYPKQTKPNSTQPYLTQPYLIYLYPKQTQPKSI